MYQIQDLAWPQRSGFKVY